MYIYIGVVCTCVYVQLYLTLRDLVDYSLPGCGLPFSTPGDLASPGIEPMYLASPVLQADSLQL